MKRRLTPPDRAEVRRRHHELFDQRADETQLLRAVKRLKNLASELRVRGLAEELNEAARLLREVGVHPPRAALAGLEPVLRDEILSLELPSRCLVTIGALLEFVAKPPEEVTHEDVERFEARPRSLGAHDRLDRGSRERSDLRKFFAALYARRGIAREVPVPYRRHLAVDVSSYPPAVRSEHRKLIEFCQSQRFTNATTRTLVGVYRRTVAWLTERAKDERTKISVPAATAEPTVAEVSWPQGGAEAFMFWAFERRNGRPRSSSAVPMHFQFYRALWRSSDHPMREVDDRLLDLKCALRVDGARRGRYTALDLRSEDPPPAPTETEVARLRELIGLDIARYRRLGRSGRSRLLRALRLRAIIETLLALGIRLSSLASLRLDQLKIDRTDETFYFDEVVVKASRERREPLVPESQLGNVTYSRWYSTTKLVEEVYAPMLAEEGYDLRAFLRDRSREEALPWMLVRSERPFGPIAVGMRASPLWRGKRGPLSASGLGDAIERACRRAGIERGRAHMFRMWATVHTNETAAASPRAAAKMLRMTEDTRLRYLHSRDSSIRRIYPGDRAASDFITGDPTAPLGQRISSTFAPALPAAADRHQPAPTAPRRSRLRPVPALLSLLEPAF